MIRLRTYKQSDAESIITWCNNKEVFELWGGERFGEYPITSDIINNKYLNNNGDCSEPDNFYPFTAFDENGIVGHFIMRYLNGNNKLLRFGWVIVDDTRRGQKIGQQMLKLGLKYAFEILMVDTVTIGVFENNIPAYKCYLSSGFHKSTLLEDSYEEINGEQWKIVELEINKDEFISD